MKRKNAVVTGFAAGLLAVAVSATAFAAQATADSAQSTALKDAGVKEENLAFVKTEIDYDDGPVSYTHLSRRMRSTIRSGTSGR